MPREKVMRHGWMIGLLAVGACQGSVEDKADEDPTESEATIACPNLVVTPEELAWTRTDVGQSDTRTITVLNECNDSGALVGTATVETSDVFAMEPADFSLMPGGSAELDVTFAPVDSDDTWWFGAVTVETNIGTVEVSLYGELPDGETDPPTDTEDTDDPTDDGDGDGYTTDDCDDSDPDVHPGAGESWDTVDEDCDGLVDEDFLSEGTVFFTEIMVDPDAVSDADGQYAELYNGASVDVDLVGLTLVDSSGNTVTIDESFVIGAGGYGVLGTTSSSSASGGVSVDHVYDVDTLDMSRSTKLKLMVGGSKLAVVKWGEMDLVTGVAMGLDPESLYYGASQDSDAWCVASSRLSGGDYGTPGVVNDDCEGGTTLDADGDGYTEAEGDCDDSDADVNPGESEVAFNDVDDDCDGETNEVALKGASSGWLEGEAGDYLGFHGLSVGDPNRDSRDELIIGGYFVDSYQGGVYGVRAKKHDTFAGTITSYDKFSVVSSSTSNFLGGVGPIQGGMWSKSKHDLAIVGSDAGTAYAGSVAAALFEGSTSISGALDQSDADVTFTDAASNHYNRALSHLDFDGDGYAELVMAEGRANFGSGDPDNNKGRVTITDVTSLSGAVSLDDADVVLLGDTQFDYLGTAIGGGDLDGDGYDDVLLGAPGEDTEGTNAGAVYLFSGDATLSEDDDIGNVSDFQLSGVTGDEVGAGQQICVADFYDDGTWDMAVAGPEGEVVYIVDDVGSISGAKRLTAKASDILDGSSSPSAYFGFGLACGDLDGDGHDDVAVGAPDDDTYLVSTFASYEGRVYIYGGSELPGGTLDEDDAQVLLIGKQVGAGAGQALLATDFDGDGTDDLVVAAPGWDTNYGRVWLVHDVGAL